MSLSVTLTEPPCIGTHELSMDDLETVSGGTNYKKIFLKAAARSAGRAAGAALVGGAIGAAIGIGLLAYEVITIITEDDPELLQT